MTSVPETSIVKRFISSALTNAAAESRAREWINAKREIFEVAPGVFGGFRLLSDGAKDFIASSDSRTETYASMAVVNFAAEGEIQVRDGTNEALVVNFQDGSALHRNIAPLRYKNKKIATVDVFKPPGSDRLFASTDSGARGPRSTAALQKRAAYAAKLAPTECVPAALTPPPTDEGVFGDLLRKFHPTTRFQRNRIAI